MNIRLTAEGSELRLTKTELNQLQRAADLAEAIGKHFPSLAAAAQQASEALAKLTAGQQATQGKSVQIQEKRGE